MPVIAQPRAASGSVSRPAPQGTSRARAPGASFRCFQRKSASARVASGGTAARQKPTARPSKKVFHQSVGAFKGTPLGGEPVSGAAR